MLSSCPRVGSGWRELGPTKLLRALSSCGRRFKAGVWVWEGEKQFCLRAAPTPSAAVWERRWGRAPARRSAAKRRAEPLGPAGDGAGGRSGLGKHLRASR